MDRHVLVAPSSTICWILRLLWRCDSGLKDDVIESSALNTIAKLVQSDTVIVLMSIGRQTASPCKSPGILPKAFTV